MKNCEDSGWRDRVQGLGSRARMISPPRSQRLVKGYVVECKGKQHLPCGIGLRVYGLKDENGPP